MPGLVGVGDHAYLTEYKHTGVFNPHFHGSTRRKKASNLSDAKAYPRVEFNIGAYAPLQSSMDVQDILSLFVYEQVGFQEWLPFIFSGDHPKGYPVKVSLDPGIIFSPVSPQWLVDGGWWLMHGI